MELLKQLVEFVQEESGKDVLTVEEKKKLEEEKNELEKEKQAVEKRLIEVKRRIKEINDRLNVKEKETSKNLKLLAQIIDNLGINPKELGIEEIVKTRTTGKTGSRRNLKNLQIFIDGKPSQWETLSRTLWYASKNCGGRNDNGSLSVEEFYKMVPGGFEAYKQGNWEVVLPNKVTIEGRMIEEKE